MKLAVVGSRGFKDYKAVWAELSRASVSLVTEVVSGGADGPDTFAEAWARSTGTPMKVFKPDWIAHGRAAGPIRNKQIVERADRVLAFWDGKSKGTKSSIDLALSLKKDLQVIFDRPQTDTKTDTTTSKNSAESDRKRM